MFPFDIEDDEINIVVESEKEPTDYEIDFETGKLTGRVITGLDAIIQWIKLVLSTDRYYYPQYSWDHGAELSELIGQNYDEQYIKSEVKRMISEAVMIDKNILGIDALECTMERDKLTVSFTVDTIYGRGEVSVRR